MTATERFPNNDCLQVRIIDLGDVPPILETIEIKVIGLIMDSILIITEN